MKKTLKIAGMHCEHCTARVEKALSALGCDVSVDLKTGIAQVTSEKEISDADLKNAVEDLGFDVLSVA